MNVKTALAAVIVLVVIFGGGYYFYTNSAANKTSETANTSNDAMMEENDESMKEDDSMMEESKSYTMAEVEAHATADDCWFVINDEVYDVTSYIADGIHPGGEAILNGCGTDATEMFFNRPNGSGSHSEKAQAFSKNFIIGTLATE